MQIETTKTITYFPAGMVITGQPKEKVTINEKMYGKGSLICC